MSDFKVVFQINCVVIAPEEMENLYVKLAYPKELLGIIFLYNMGVGGWMVGEGA